MHDGAVVGVASQEVWNDFTKSFRENAFVNMTDGMVYIFFGGGDSALVVTVGGQGEFVWAKLSKSIVNASIFN
jgi:hypothetical protein